MKRTILVGILAMLAVLATSQAAVAAPAPHPGCKGNANAQSQSQSNRSANGQAALASVADKLGCTPPADPLACPAGQQALSEWTWDPADPDATDPTRSFVPVGATTTPYPAYGDPGGFYIEGAPAPLSVVLQSTTGEIVTVTYGPGQQVESGQAVSQNWFADRTGIQTVRFCG